MTARLTVSLWGVVMLGTLGIAGVSSAEVFIVENGQANAEIVIAPDSPRMVEIAAKDLQIYVLKMTGAELPIVAEPTAELPVKIYVGRSEHTDRLGVSDEGLTYGAYRMASGPDWLALVGRDFDFEPVDPWPQRHQDREEANLAWDEVTGHHWVNPMHALQRDYNPSFGVWRHDEGGSLNAVCDFLRSLGVRWYMPGEIGEVVPTRDSISLPEVGKTARPSFALRKLKWSSYSLDWDDMMWDRRMGLNSGYELWGAKSYKSHGMRAVIGRKEMQEAHPEYYALLRGVRDTDKGGTGTPCLRSPGLIRETVAFVRASFDHYDEPMVCVWPTDGFSQCQCDLCKDIDNVSDYVWGFVETVAREVYKTHPDRKVSCGAYSSYVDPPESIEKFSPNVVVYIANRGRPWFGDPERWERYWETIEAWRQKVAPGNLIRGENNLISGRSHPTAFPPLHPREFAKDLKALQGVGQGERNESPRGSRSRVPGREEKQNTWRFPGVDHLNLYVNARFLWDANQDIEAMLDEYYTLFYGPARDEMQAAFEFADANFPAPPDPLRPGRMPSFAIRARLMDMLREARKAAGDTVYGERVQFVIDELPPLEELRRLAHEEAHAPDPRADAPLVVGRRADGMEDPETYRMRDLITGEEPEIETTFRVLWDGDAVVFDFHCEEPDMENLHATRRVWDGDSVAMLIETPVFAYYQIEVGPEGAVYDAARNVGLGIGTGWSALAEVETERGDDWWRVRVRLPVAGEDGLEMDPNHNIAGGKPTDEMPWFFNVGRARYRNGKKTNQAFSPTGASYHERDKLVRLAIR